MSFQNIAIPLHGKMVYRSLHSIQMQSEFSAQELQPIFYVEKSQLSPWDKNYAELSIDEYQQILDKPFMLFSTNMRWFMVQTQSTESRFRNLISDLIWSTDKLNQALLKAIVLNILRNAKFLATPLIWGEELHCKIDYHASSWKKNNIQGVLVSGIGNRDFEVGGLFAREAFRQGIPVVSTITNYDNLLSKGYRGFTPDHLAVWSEKMKQQATTLMDIPENKVVITGPTVFDRYFEPLQETREEFLRKHGLDPDKKTLFYAGHTSIVTYFDFLDLVMKFRQPGGVLEKCNLIIRPYPHQKVHNWAGIKFFSEKLTGLPNVYISDPFESSSDTFSPFSEGALEEKSTDELHAILKFSDVMVNYFSTLGLEAAICDLPTIHIGYDKFTYQISPMAWCTTGRRNAHNQDRQRRAASKIVESDTELEQALEAYLGNHALDREERYSYALSECGYLDGKATQRLAKLVAETTNNQRK
jgi:hypothetical protein